MKRITQGLKRPATLPLRPGGRLGAGSLCGGYQSVAFGERFPGLAPSTTSAHRR